ncbi:MAG TPA: hypothetical protein VJ836_06520 [Candidatus Saccharimonadales bacterium]|nr:hypothetical protein [Candidatus Saccharimonadales bacterium]
MYFTEVTPLPVTGDGETNAYDNGVPPLVPIYPGPEMPPPAVPPKVYANAVGYLSACSVGVSPGLLARRLKVDDEMASRLIDRMAWEGLIRKPVLGMPDEEADLASGWCEVIARPNKRTKTIS